MPSSVAKAWVKTGVADARPIDVRAQEARERLWRAIPASHPLREVANQPADDISIIQMDEAVEKYRAEQAAAAAPDPRHRIAIDELWNLKKCWNEVATEIQTAQRRWLQFAADNWKHVLRKSITADMYTEVAPFPMAVGEDRAFDSYDTARAAAKDLFPRLQWARGVLSQIHDAQTFDSLDRASQSLELIQALIAENTALKNRMKAIEAQLGAISAIRNPPRQKKLKVRKASRRQATQQEAQPQ